MGPMFSQACSDLDELRAVVAADELGGTVPLNEAEELVEYVPGPDAPGHIRLPLLPDVRFS